MNLIIKINNIEINNSNNNYYNIIGKFLMVILLTWESSLFQVNLTFCLSPKMFLIYIRIMEMPNNWIWLIMLMQTCLINVNTTLKLLRDILHVN